MKLARKQVLRYDVHLKSQFTYRQTQHVVPCYLQCVLYKI